MRSCKQSPSSAKRKPGPGVLKTPSNREEPYDPPKRGQPACGTSEFRAPITFARHHPTMSDATAPPEAKPQPSLFTRVRAVEAELEAMKALVAGLAQDHEALRTDRDEWRWRAEYLLAERQSGFLDRWGRRLAEAVNPLVRRLSALLKKAGPALRDAFRGVWSL